MINVFNEGQSIFNTIQEQEVIDNLTKQTVDLSEIYTVLYDLFDKQGSLVVRDTNTYENSPDKIVFNFSHPSKDLDTNNNVTVSYDLVERKRLEYDTSVGSITQKKPREVAQYYDIETGGVKTALSYSYTNKVQLTVIASTVEKLYQTLLYLETTFTRDVGYLLTRFTKFCYEGIYSNSLTSSNDPYGRNIHSKTICLRIDTETPFNLVHEQIQQIEY